MQVEQKVNIHNRFDIHIDNVESGEHREIVAFNIVLDQMFTKLCNGESYFANIHFGTGSGTLNKTRTSLFTHLGTKTAVDVEKVKALPVSRVKKKIVLNPEEFIGAIISEVGVSFGSTATNLVTHAMLKDTEGNPITITKTSTDVVTIYATIFATFTNSNSDLIWLGVPTTNSLMKYLIDGDIAPIGTFGLLPGEHFGARIGSSAAPTWTADIINKKRKTSTIRFGINDANGNVKSINFANTASTTHLFSLKLPASGIFDGQQYTGVSLGNSDGIKTDFVLPSSNIRQNSISIKKDGIIITDFNKLDFGGKPVQIGNVYHNQGVTSAIVSRNGKYFTACKFNGNPSAQVEVFEMDINNQLVPISLPVLINYTYGYGAAISEDGLVLNFVYSTSPKLRSFDKVDGTWIERPSPSVISPQYGYSNFSADGNTVMLYPGYIYDWDGTSWILRPSTGLSILVNRSASMSADGKTIACTNNTTVYSAYWDGITWTMRPSITMPANCKATLNSSGTSIAVTSVDATQVLLKVYDWNGNAWIQRGNTLSISANIPGAYQAISEDGNTVAISKSNGPLGTHFIKYIDNKYVDTGMIDTPAAEGPCTMSDDGSLVGVVTPGRGELLSFKNRNTLIKFNTPPVAGTITADYTVDGVHKTDQYVIDVSFAIAFGEGA